MKSEKEIQKMIRIRNSKIKEISCDMDLKKKLRHYDT